MEKTHQFHWRSHGLSISFSDVGAAELGRKALQLVCRQRDSANLWEFWTSKGRFTFPGWFSIVSLLLRRNLPSTPPNFSDGVFYPLPAFFPWSFMVFFIPSVLPIIIIPMWNPRLPRLPGGHPDFPYGGFPKLGGTPKKTFIFRLGVSNKQSNAIGISIFQPFEAQVWRRFSGRTWLLLLLGEQVAGRCPKNGGLSPQFFVDWMGLK